MVPIESSDRRVQLDQLLHFLEGANANQARDIGSDTAFYSVLVALLESADPSSSEVLKVLDLLVRKRPGSMITVADYCIRRISRSLPPATTNRCL